MLNLHRVKVVRSSWHNDDWLGRLRLSSLKLNSVAYALLVSGAALSLSACSTVGSAWDYFTNDNDPSLRTPTGYYEHTDVTERVDPLNIPAGLDNPYTDRSLDIPPLEITPESASLVGENMDVRPPVVPQIGRVGVEIVSVNDSAIIWFLPYGRLAVNSNEQAWSYLNSVINFLKLRVSEYSEDRMALATAPSDFNASGEPYDEASLETGALRYKQSYRVEVGHSAQGQIGYVVSLVSSDTLKSDDDSSFHETLNQRQKRSFTVGFANTIVKTLILQTSPQELIPDNVSVLLSRDHNDQDALLVKAPYSSTWNVMHGLLSQYGFKVSKYSVSSSSYTVKFTEEDPEFYQNLGVQSFNLESGEYVVRLGVGPNNTTTITFFNEDDKPLPAISVAALYSGMSQAIAKEFVKYKLEPANYVAKFSEED